MNTSEKIRTLWPLAIITAFVVFGTALIVFIVFATGQKMELVRPDYYEEEMRYQEQVDRLNRTEAVSGEIVVAYDAPGRRITITLPAAHARLNTSGRIHLYRPSDAGLDQDLPLAIDPAGIQHLDAARLQAGLWKIRVYWTAADREYFVDRSVTVGS